MGEKTSGDRQQSLADRLRASRDIGVDNSPHVIVEARAGTGKTTTLIEGLKRVKGLGSTLTPSSQQAAVWEAMELSKGKAQTICFVAFNKSIATELQSRVPQGCDAMTMHSLGFKAVQKVFSRVSVNSYRVQDIISELLEKDIRELRRTKSEVIKATEELVGLCKMNLVGFSGCATSPDYHSQPWIESLSDLANYYDVDTNGHATEIFDLVPRVLERCKDVTRDGCIDFNDMIWIPVVLDLNVYKYDLLLIDEFQDCNRCQHALAKKAGKRLICCGDPKQSIYGFAGADCNSMTRMEQELSATERGCIHLPLTVTRRCGKAIVAEANKIVPDFAAFETNPEGKVSHFCLRVKDDVTKPHTEQLDYRSAVADGDMVLCRCNAPLVSECFNFIRQGRKANIQGRDVGVGLVKTVQKLMKSPLPIRVEAGRTGGDDCTLSHEIETLHRRLDDWLHAEERKENAKRNPSEQRLVNLQDRRDCLLCFTEGARTTEDVIRKIESIFTDDKSSSGIRLSSVHKAKGLEARRVFILVPKESPMPHSMAKTAWEKEQEMNIKYVAITRAKEELVYVS
jgi:superfamily I DNA/RNA helicase